MIKDLKPEEINRLGVDQLDELTDEEYFSLSPEQREAVVLRLVDLGAMRDFGPPPYERKPDGR